MITVNGNPILINGNFIRDVSYVTPMNPYTLRLKFRDGVTPTFRKGTGVQVSSSPNIWDLTYENNDWTYLLYGQDDLLEVIYGNTTGVIRMTNMFSYCTSLTSVHSFDTSSVISVAEMFFDCESLSSIPWFNTSNVVTMRGMFSSCKLITTVPLFDTSKVTTMSHMFTSCSRLTSVPLFNTSNVTNMDSMLTLCGALTSVPLFDTSKVSNMNLMLEDCIMVQTGALALYQQASSQTYPPNYHDRTFNNCGTNTQTGSAELAQIPSDWK